MPGLELWVQIEHWAQGLAEEAQCRGFWAFNSTVPLGTEVPLIKTLTEISWPSLLGGGAHQPASSARFPPAAIGFLASALEPCLSDTLPGTQSPRQVQI